MKWTAYYMADNAFTGEKMPVYLHETFKTRKALVEYLKSIGWSENEYFHCIMEKEIDGGREIATLIKK